MVRSDGSIYFADSPGALYNVGMAAEDLQQYLDFQGVFRISPDGAKLDAVVTDTVYPNGLAFATDESVLYVNDHAARGNSAPTTCVRTQLRSEAPLSQSSPEASPASADGNEGDREAATSIAPARAEFT